MAIGTDILIDYTNKRIYQNTPASAPTYTAQALQLRILSSKQLLQQSISEPLLDTMRHHLLLLFHGRRILP